MNDSQAGDLHRETANGIQRAGQTPSAEFVVDLEMISLCRRRKAKGRYAPAVGIAAWLAGAHQAAMPPASAPRPIAVLWLRSTWDPGLVAQVRGRRLPLERWAKGPSSFLYDLEGRHTVEGGLDGLS